MKNINWVSNLKTISTLSVIIMHSAAYYVGDYNIHPADQTWWIIGNIVDSFVRFCVPVFIMISGSLWFSGTDSMIVFYKKRILRLIGPFLFWSLAHYFFNMLYMGYQSRHVHIFENFYDQLRLKVINAHFWYVYMLIGLVLLAPLLQAWIKNASKKELEFFLITWVIVLIYQSSFLNSIRIPFDVYLLPGLPGYLVLGYYLTYHVNSIEQKQKNLGKILFFLGVLITIVGTHIISTRKQTFDALFYDYLSFNVMTAAAGIFLWMKNVIIKNQLIQSATSSVSRYGYGIYLCHIMAMNLFVKYYMSVNVHPLLFIPCMTALSFFISWGVIYLLNKIPYANYVVG